MDQVASLSIRANSSDILTADKRLERFNKTATKTETLNKVMGKSFVTAFRNVKKYASDLEAMNKQLQMTKTLSKGIKPFKIGMIVSDITKSSGALDRLFTNVKKVNAAMASMNMLLADSIVKFRAILPGITALNQQIAILRTTSRSIKPINLAADSKGLIEARARILGLQKIVAKIEPTIARLRVSSLQLTLSLMKLSKAAKSAATAVYMLNSGMAETHALNNALKTLMTTEKNLARATQQLAAQQRNMNAAFAKISTQTNTATRSVRSYTGSTSRAITANSSLISSLKGLVAFETVRRSIVGTTTAMDDYTRLSNRLTAVTKTTEQFKEAQGAVFQIAQTTRQPLQEVAELYQRLAINQEALGISSARVAGLTETISKAMTLSGVSTQAASGALIQLGQAFSSGVLRGQELNSVLEQAPGLAQAMADGLGIPRYELKRLGDEGLLTVPQLITAFEKMGNKVDQDFSKIRFTISDTFTRIGNSLTFAIGLFDQTTGASQSFNEQLVKISEWIDTGTLSDGLVAGFFNLQFIIDELTAPFRDFVANLKLLQAIFPTANNDIERFGEIVAEVFATFGPTIKAAMRLGVAYVATFVDESAAMIRNLAAAWDLFKSGQLASAGISAASAITNANRALEFRVSAEKRADIELTRQKEIAEIQQKMQESAKKAAAERKKAEEERIRQIKEARDKAMKAAFPDFSGAGGKGAKGATEELNDAQKRWIALQKEGIQLTEQARTPLEKYIDTAAHLQDMLAGQFIDEETFDRLIAKEKEVLDNAQKVSSGMNEFFVQAARNMESAMADGFFDIMQGNFDNLGDSFKNTIDRMVADLLASQLTTFLFGAGFGQTGNLGGVVGDAANWFSGLDFGSMFSFEGGGFTGEGQRMGGLDGKGGMLAMVHPNETVVDHEKGQSNASTPVTVNINVSGVKDSGDLKRTSAQIAQRAGAASQRAISRNG